MNHPSINIIYQIDRKIKRKYCFVYFFVLLHYLHLQLKDEQTIHEFMSFLGVKEQDYDELLRSIENIRKATSHDELSYAFCPPHIQNHLMAKRSMGCFFTAKVRYFIIFVT